MTTTGPLGRLLLSGALALPASCASVPNDRAPPPMYKAAGKFEGNVDRGQIVDFVS
mgnify:CR=1 FL=1